MKILYTYTNNVDPIYIDTTDQKVLICFQDSGDNFIYYANDYTHMCYINRVVNINLQNWATADNLEVIENDAQFDKYVSYINANYNYQGLHVTEKIDGQA